MSTHAPLSRCLDESGQPIDLEAELRARQGEMTVLTAEDLIARLTEPERAHPTVALARNGGSVRYIGQTEVVPS